MVTLYAARSLIRLKTPRVTLLTLQATRAIQSSFYSCIARLNFAELVSTQLRQKMLTDYQRSIAYNAYKRRRILLVFHQLQRRAIEFRIYSRNFFLYALLLFFKELTKKYLELDNSASFPELRQGVFIKLLEIFIRILLIILKESRKKMLQTHLERFLRECRITPLLWSCNITSPRDQIKKTRATLLTNQKQNQTQSCQLIHIFSLFPSTCFNFNRLCPF